MVQIAEARPPYVRFEVRAEEDRTASLEAGHFIGTDIIYVLITPQGSKDCIERKAEEWFAKLRQDLAEDRLPQLWYDNFQSLFRAFQEGVEPPVTGTAIENWPPITPSQLRTLRELGIRTVEDLAGLNEEAISRMGMGSRALKQRAADWLATASDAGVLSGQLEALRAEVENLRTVNTTLRTELTKCQGAQGVQVPSKLVR